METGGKYQIVNGYCNVYLLLCTEHKHTSAVVIGIHFPLFPPQHASFPPPLNPTFISVSGLF